MCYSSKEAVPAIREREPHYVLVLSHGKRMQLNHKMNTRLANGRTDTMLLEPPEVKRGSMANLPQTMRIWPGMKLQACAKVREANVVNGLEYEVVSFTKEKVEF